MNARVLWLYEMLVAGFKEWVAEWWKPAESALDRFFLFNLGGFNDVGATVFFFNLVFVSCFWLAFHRWMTEHSSFYELLVFAGCAAPVVALGLVFILFIAYTVDLFILLMFPAFAMFWIWVFAVNAHHLIAVFGGSIAVFVFYFSLPAAALVWLLPHTLAGLRAVFTDKDRQAYMLFMGSLVLLGWAVLRQVDGNFGLLAVWNVPVTIPGLGWKIPLTESIGFPFALLGFARDPVGAAVSTTALGSTNELIALFGGAAVLFFLAENRLHQSAVGVRWGFALLAFALFWAAVYLETFMHATTAPEFGAANILLNRTLAVLALAVYLFWRRVAKAGELVEGADGEFKKACDWAEGQAWKIALWLLVLVFVVVRCTYVWPNGFPDGVKVLLTAFLVAFPVRWIVGFKREFDGMLVNYHRALKLQQESYQPPPIVAGDEETRRALGE